MTTIFEKLRYSVLPHLIPPHTRLLVAVSGGPDSMALSHVLWRYSQEARDQEISLVLTHVHHGVRRESDEEEVMVQAMAQNWGIPCVVHRFNAMEYAQATGQSFEAAAREWRYSRWKEDMLEYHCTLLATAHHLGDQAETVLYRLLRGSGTAGLAGIYPRKGEIIRPFLTLSKDEILEYCEAERIPYALDSTNFERTYTRNRIRLELIPKLQKSYNPRILETIGRTAEVLRWDEEYLELQVSKAWDVYCLFNTGAKVQLSHEIFKEPKAILSRLLRRAASLITGEPRGLAFNYVQEIMSSEGKVGWKQDLPGFSVDIQYDGVSFLGKILMEKGDEINELQLESLFTTLPRLNEWVELPGLHLWAGLFEAKMQDSEVKKYEEIWAWADFDREGLLKFGEKLCFRTRLAGDKFWIQGVGHRSLKKVFQEAKVKAIARNSLPLLAVDSQILWIPGVRQSDFCRVGKGPRVRVLIRRKPGETRD